MPQYDPVIYSRILTALTLAFHIIYATIGVGMPLMIGIAEFIGIRKRDPHYILLAKRWSRGFVITVAVGVVTGTAIALQLSLLWPSFMRVAGQAIALPLFMETFAFFFEAIFLGIYLYTWTRFPNPWHHFLLVIPVIIGSSASAFFITTVNAFMNTPTGFTLSGHQITHIQPWKAMFNPATPTEVSHVLSSAYMTVAFILASIAAYSILKGSKHAYYKKALNLTMNAGFIFTLATAFIGDLSGKFLAQYQPIKLAAGEWHFQTAKQAALVIGGWLGADQSVKYGIRIPYALSFLAKDNFNAVVQGLREFPRKDWPPLMIHYMFDTMVLIGSLLGFIALLYLLSRWIKTWNPHHRLQLILILLSGPLSLVAIECGWIFDEVGRQPWILVGYMRTTQGATTSAHVNLMLYLFILLYIVLGGTSLRVLAKLFRGRTAEQELNEDDRNGGGAHV